MLFLTAITALTAQQKNISLEEIWGGAYRIQGLDALHSMNNGKEYAVLNYDRQNKASTVDVYDYKSGEKVRTLLNSADLKGINLSLIHI